MNKNALFAAFLIVFATIGVANAVSANNSGNPFDELQGAVSNLTAQVAQLFTKTEDLQNQVNSIDARNTTVNVQNNVPVPNVTVINNVNAGNNGSRTEKYELFLKIDDIKGESTDSNHLEWINALAYNHSMNIQIASGGSGGGKAVHNDFVVTKLLDKSSPTLALDLNKGVHIKDAELDVVNAETGLTYMKYVLSDVMISSMSVNGDVFGDNSRPTEEISLNYQKIEWTYSTGSGDIHTGWDVAAGKAI